MAGAAHKPHNDECRARVLAEMAKTPEGQRRIDEALAREQASSSSDRTTTVYNNSHHNHHNNNNHNHHNNNNHNHHNNNHNNQMPTQHGNEPPAPLMKKEKTEAESSSRSTRRRVSQVTPDLLTPLIPCIHLFHQQALTWTMAPKPRSRQSGKPSRWR